MKTLKQFLEEHKACLDGFEFAKDLTLEQFLNTCDRGDWILWLFVRMNPESKRELTLAKGQCANTVRHLMKDKRSLDAVDIAIKYGNNEATEQELDAAYAADAAAYAAFAAADADADAAAYAAIYAAIAADAAYAAIYAADAAAYAAIYAAIAADAAIYAADAAAYAAYAAFAAAAKKDNQKLTADICRKYLPLAIWDQSKL